MTNMYSTDNFFEWLDGQRRKGVLNEASYASYKTAAKRIFASLRPAEASDLRRLDLAELFLRWKPHGGATLQTITQQSYEGRVQAAMAGFLARSPDDPSPSAPATLPRTSRYVTSSLPIQIRADLTVYLQGVPFDLTQAEAKRISNVVLAMANS